MVKYSRIIKKFTTALSKLKKAKIIHSGSWKGDIGEYLAIERFKLKRKNTKGYDAIDNKGRKVEIKTFAGKSKFPQFGIDMKIKKFNYAILVVLDETTLIPKMYYKVSYRNILKNRSKAEINYKRFDLYPKRLNKLKKKKKIIEYAV